MQFYRWYLYYILTTSTNIHKAVHTTNYNYTLYKVIKSNIKNVLLSGCDMEREHNRGRNYLPIQTISGHFYHLLTVLTCKFDISKIIHIIFIHMYMDNLNHK